MVGEQQPMPQQQYQQPYSNPIINFTEGNKESIIKVMFNLDPNVVDWLAGDWYDGHMEQSNDGVPIIVPNAMLYECQWIGRDNDGKETRCSVVKRKDPGAPMAHTSCAGTQAKPHERFYTQPKDWRPKLKSAGMSFLMGQCKAMINSNISTGNISKSQMDVKRKAELEDRLMGNSFFMAYTVPAIILNEWKEYIADWIIQEKKLHIVFSSAFIANFIVAMATNIQSNLTKGKGMEAARAVMENKVRTESETHASVDYQNPYGMMQKKESGNPLSSLFNFGGK